jgi:hypothetical protein
MVIIAAQPGRPAKATSIAANRHDRPRRASSGDPLV